MDETNIMDVDYTFNDRLGPCEVCGVKDSIYTCPKCEVKTCCLKCVRIHKKELECDGIRDKTKFLKINNFTNLDLLSDYRLLEEASRTVERCKQQPNLKQQQLPLHLYRLNAACVRRNTIIKFLPKEFTRRKANTTLLDWKAQVIYWKIEWIFPEANNTKLIDDRCSEQDKFGTLLQKYFDENDSNQLEYYQSKGMSGCQLLLKAEQKRGGKQYYELDLSSTLKDSLKYKIIIENPTIYVIFKENASLYTCIDPDEEKEKLIKEEATINENSIMSNILNVKHKLHKSKKNKRSLLISNDDTDDEDEGEKSSEDSIDIKIPKRMFNC